MIYIHLLLCPKCTRTNISVTCVNPSNIRGRIKDTVSTVSLGLYAIYSFICLHEL